MNFILPLILIISSLGTFFWYVDPQYKGSTTMIENKLETYGVKQLEEEVAKYQETVDNSTKVTNAKTVLLNKSALITEVQKDRLIKMLPDNIDNVKLLVEITSIAKKRNLAIKSISFGGDSSKTSEAIGPDNTPYGTLSLKFGVSTTYETFLDFLSDLENNLRLIDVTDISFTSTESGFYDFSVSLNTYWLK